MQQGHFRLRQAAVSGHGRGHRSSPRQPLYALAPSRTVVGGSREVASQALLSVRLAEPLPPQAARTHYQDQWTRPERELWAV